MAKIEALTVDAGDWNLFYNRRAMCGLWAEVYFWKAGSPAKAEGNWDKVKEYAALSIDDRKMADSPLQIEVMFDPLSVSSSPVLSVNVVSDYGGAYLDIFADMWSPVTVEEEVLKLFSEDNYRKEFWIDPARIILLNMNWMMKGNTMSMCCGGLKR